MKLSKIISLLRKLLLPIGWIYGLIVYLRNKAFDWGWLHQTPFSVPIIVVGNITVGGTGKTPVTEYIIDTLYSKHKIGLLSRGYGRKTKGVIYADVNATAQTIGDEPFQIKNKFPLLETCVSEKRVLGAEVLVNKGVDVIVCDDAFQHRYIKPTKAIVVMDYNRPLWKDLMLPAGELRESPAQIRRADVVIVSKCPSNLEQSYKKSCVSKIGINPQQEIFFTTIKYGVPTNLFDTTKSFPKGAKVLALSGIAQPKPFYNYLEKNYHVIDAITFPDHHNFTEVEITAIAHRLQKINEEFVIITTEKDATRLKQFSNFKYSSEIWFLPIKIGVLFEEEKEFKTLIESYVIKDKRDNKPPSTNHQK